MMMFAARRMEIARRKERLIALAAVQRTQAANAFRRWEGPAAVIDRGIEAVRYVKSHPLLLGAAVAVLVVAGRRSVFKWVGRGFVAWRAWQSLAPWRRRFGM
jgi:hypothetical protein